MISIIFLLSTAVLAQASPRIFESWNGNTRIVGGEDAKIREFPYMASIRGAKFGEHLCGGSIISDKCILTAAHCVDEREPDQIKIMVGTDRLEADSGGTSYQVSQINLHEDYNKTNTFSDIAVLQLKKKITFSKDVKSISISAKEPKDGDRVEVSGWGRLHFEDFQVSNKLQKQETQIYNREKCKKAFVNDSKPVTSNNVCTLPGESKGVCGGDSGGPLKNEHSEQVGIVSFSKGCGYGLPDVYTNTHAFSEWIKKHCKK